MDIYQKQLLFYLDKNYYIKNNTFFERTEVQDWGRSIVELLSKVLGINISLCDRTFKDWAHGIGFPNNETLWDRSYQPQRLETQWCPEISQSLGYQEIRDLEKELTTSLITKVAKEIESDFLASFIGSEIGPNNFFELIKCEGYTIGPLIYDPTTQSAMKSFLSITYHDLLNERQNNIQWQNWVRSTKRNPEA